MPESVKTLLHRIHNLLTRLLTLTHTFATVRFTAWTLVVFYFLSVCGYGLELHYCLGQVTDVNYALFDTSCVCDEGHEESYTSNCCEEKAFFVQLDEDHQAASKVAFKLPFIVLPASFLNIQEAVADQSTNQLNDRGPPLIVDRCTVYCSFQLYG